jgi:hypothetical protein
MTRFYPQLTGILSFDYTQESSIGFRLKTCFLEANQGKTYFKDCARYPSGKPANDVLLWETPKPLNCIPESNPRSARKAK